MLRNVTKALALWIGVFSSIGTAMAQCPLNFGEFVSCPSTWQTSCLAIVDLNHDGRPDVITGGYNEGAGGGQVAVLLGDRVSESGLLGLPVSFPLGAAALSMVVADFNGDGLPDVAVATVYPSGIRIMLGTATLGFSAPVSYGAGGNPNCVVVCDFNHDGKPDLAATDATSGAVFVLLGNGDGTFLPGASYDVGEEPRALAVIDADRDGVPDLVAPHFGTVSLLRGNGDGSFQAPISFPVFGEHAVSVAVGDLNRDGLSDLVVGDEYQAGLSILLASPTPETGLFLPAVHYEAGSMLISIAIADLDGDGRADLAVSTDGFDRISVLRGNGDGTFQPYTLYPDLWEPREVVVADMNGDCKPDLVTPCVALGYVQVLLNKTVSADFNHDGDVGTDSDIEDFFRCLSGNCGQCGVADFNGDGDIGTDADIAAFFVALAGGC